MENVFYELKTNKNGDATTSKTAPAPSANELE